MIEKLAEIKIRIARGQSIFYELKNAILIATGIKILFDTDLKTTIILTISAILAFFFIGWFDLKFIKLFQTEQVLITEKYNPYLGSLKKRNL